MSSNFGSKELIKALLALDFIQDRQTGSRHLKFSTPDGWKIPENCRPFIIVIQNKKYDPYTSKKYFRQLLKLGFKKADILNYLKYNPK